MQSIIIEEAWKDLSRSFEWSENTLEKFQDQVDWDEISESIYFHWTIPMVQKFQKRINWNRFSKNISENTLTEKMLETFKEKWDWHELSCNYRININDSMLEKYADRWDWECIINRHSHDQYRDRGMDFYEKYKEYIPITKLARTCLWREMINQQMNHLINEING